MASTHKAVADNPARMGRPPLGVRPLTVRLSAEQIARIEAVAGPNKTAAFIRDAVTEKLARAEKGK
ncbi:MULTISPECIES: hypothetical protein [unclassified Sphingomonas]|uniref:hypothetical protein n=1 Tax=unclassified Sphingomonas TaxID=196159 RepID=UPI001AC6C70C|nr:MULTISPECIES: hypothetical protein [unclassified Sphingomonas]MBN8848183.1 hypothetical protein [Sphingomonas sp.]